MQNDEKSDETESYPGSRTAAAEMLEDTEQSMEINTE
jgi:hypothetical protein